MHPLLEIKNLSVDFLHDLEINSAVKNISFTMNRGKITAIVGESGSGKSVTALSILQLLPKDTKLTGEILFSSNGADRIAMQQLSSKQMNAFRGKKISMIFQEPMTSLNPVLTCGFQVMESLRTHKQLSGKQAEEESLRLFEQVELPNPAAMLKRYPHQISGGQKQRVMIAMAMACHPDIIIADEPTTALDVRMQKSILLLIKKLQQQNNMALLLITHDLGLVADVADEVLIMYKGNIVEQGVASQILAAPQHPYSKALLACRPSAKRKGKKLLVLNDFLTPDEKQMTVEPTLVNNISNKIPDEAAVLSIQNLKVYFTESKNIFGKPISFIKAVDDVSFEVKRSETIGLVGESGCGKTTLGRAILRLQKPTSGQILLEGKDISTLSSKQSRELGKDLQIVFQDPYGSLNPRISIGKAILEPLQVHQLYSNNKSRREVVIDSLEKVQLSADHFNRYPHQFSGGQRQRICIARALVLNPSFLVFDESVSALDVSVQASILNLVNDLKSSYHFTSIFISHDLAVVHYISDRILVMNKGKIIEEGSADEIYFNPKMLYTQKLIDSIPGKAIG